VRRPGSSRSCAPERSSPPIRRSRNADPGDDYLIALAEQEQAVLVSGDKHLLALGEELPIETARAFLDKLGTA
jgi:predicted nucleic acid-binding protein